MCWEIRCLCGMWGRRRGSVENGMRVGGKTALRKRGGRGKIGTEERGWAGKPPCACGNGKEEGEPWDEARLFLWV